MNTAFRLQEGAIRDQAPLVYQARYIGEVRHRDVRSPEAVPRSRSTATMPAPVRAWV